MHTQCNSTDLTFEGLGRREVIGKFDGGRMSSDGGSVLLRASNRVLDLTARLARCFSDYRDERRTEHSVQALVGRGCMAWLWATRISMITTGFATTACWRWRWSAKM